jgi:ribosomal protein L3 glutamine methyltransferase
MIEWDSIRGGKDGLELVRNILKQAPDDLNADGHLVVEVGMARQQLETEYPHLPFMWLNTEESEGEVFWLAAKHIA